MWNRVEPKSIFSTLMKFIHSNHSLPTFICTDIFFVSCHYLSLNTEKNEKALHDSLSIIKQLLCHVKFNNSVAKLLKSSLETAFPWILKSINTAILLSSILCAIIRQKQDFFFLFFSLSLRLLERDVNASFTKLVLIPILQTIRRFSLEAYRQTWLKNGILCLIDHYDQKNLLATLDLFCPLFMYSGGVEWLLQFPQKLPFILSDIIDDSLTSIFHDVYQEDLLSTMRKASHFPIMDIFSFFRLGANRTEWVNFCNECTKGKLICYLSSIAFKAIEDEPSGGKLLQSLQILRSYCRISKYSIFVLWPIVVMLRSNSEPTRENFQSVIAYAKHVEKSFDLSISHLAFPYQKGHQLAGKFRFVLLSLYLAKNFEQVLQDPNISTGFIFKETLANNSIVLQSLSSGNSHVYIGASWEYSFLKHLYDVHLSFESEHLFISTIPNEQCKFCSLITLIHFCNYLNIASPVLFLFSCLRKSIATCLFNSTERKHNLSICLFSLLRLFPFNNLFKLTLIQLLFVTRFDDVEPYLDLIYAIFNI